MIFTQNQKKKKKNIWFIVLPIMHGSHYKSIMKGSKISTKNDRQWMVLITNATCLFDPKLYMKGGFLWFRWGTKIFINNNNLIMKYHVGLCAIKLRDSYKCWSQMLLLSKKKKKKTTTTIHGLSAPTTTGEKRVTGATGEQQLTHYIFQRKKLNMHSTTIRIFLSVFLF